MFLGPVTESIIGRAVKAGKAKITIHSLRTWSEDKKHAKVDHRPYGGGAGMVIMAEPLYRAVKALGGLKKGKSRPHVVLMSPQGRRLDQKLAEKLARRKKTILLCGHYEGVDERVMAYVDEEISIGDFVMTGGELPAMVLMDAVIRLQPGVVGDPDSIKKDSFSSGILDYPHYTRPRMWRGQNVPDVLLSGDHQRIEMWQKSAAVKQTKVKRPDLFKLSS